VGIFLKLVCCASRLRELLPMDSPSEFEAVYTLEATSPE
jgi:hypothetical protein